MSKYNNKFISWIINHDDSKIFMVLYIGLAVVLSIWISLFWLLAVVGVHFVFELIKEYYESHNIQKSVAKAIWEIKLDIVLVLFAVWLSIYMNFVFGIVGIGAASRALTQTGARFAAWQRVIRGILLSLDDVAQVARFGLKKTENNKELFKEESVQVKAKNEKTQVTKGDVITLVFLVIFLLLILFAPFLTEHGFKDVVNIIIEEFKPIP